MGCAVVVTGLGIVSPAGLAVRDYWAMACGDPAGQRGAARPGRPARPEPPLPYGQGRQAAPGGHGGQAWARPQHDRIARLALAAADWALADAGISPADLPGVRPEALAAAAVATIGTPAGPGGAVPGFGSAPRAADRPRPPGRGAGYRSFAWFYSVATGRITVRDGMKGLDAVAHARREIRRSGSVIVSGGVDAPVCPHGRTEGARPAGAAAARPGGGALLVLEDAVGALTRGAEIYGEVAGYGATFDPDPAGAPDRGLRRAVELALRDAWCGPHDVDAVFAPALGAAEAAAITGVFGVHTVPVTAPRTAAAGRHQGAAAPLDLAAALLAMREGLIPPTADGPPAPGYDLNVVRSPRTAELRTTVVLGRGHGGFTSAVVLRAVD